MDKVCSKFSSMCTESKSRHAQIISGHISLSTRDPTSDLSANTPQFTLTCISTGGPVTTVTWTRDSVTVTEGTKTVLDDPVTAQYTHTLTVTTGGVYTCTVANGASTSSADISLKCTALPYKFSILILYFF